jgi:hypothetical protein
MRLPQPRFTMRWLMVAVLFLAVSLAILSEGWRSSMWNYHDQMEHGCLAIAEGQQQAADECERWGRGADAARFAASAQKFRDQAKNHVLAKSGFRPGRWSGDLLVKLLRLPLTEKLWLFLAGAIVAIGVGVALLRYQIAIRSTSSSVSSSSRRS